MTNAGPRIALALTIRPGATLMRGPASQARGVTGIMNRTRTRALMRTPATWR